LAPKRKLSGTTNLFEATNNHPNEQMQQICMKINHNCPNGQAKFQKHMTLFCYETKGCHGNVHGHTQIVRVFQLTSPHVSLSLSLSPAPPPSS
jgi:hypothetical protein